MKSLNIAFIVGEFPLVSETFIANQLAFLIGHGHEITILCTRKKNLGHNSNPPLETYGLLNRTKILTIKALMPKKLIKQFFVIIQTLFKSITTPAFFELIKSFNFFKYPHWKLIKYQFFKVYYKNYFLIHNFDVVHVHFADNAMHLIEQLKKFNKKMVVTFHGYDAHNYDKYFYMPLLELTTIEYTVNTNYTQQKVIDLGFPVNKIKVLPVGLDTSFFKPEFHQSQNIFNIIFVGRLIELKGPLLAIKIVEEVLKSNERVIFSIIGEGNQFEVCNTYVKNNNLEKHVLFLGSRNQEEIKALLLKSDLLLFPGIIDKNDKAEAQGLVIQEAQAMGVPVIISDVGGMKEGVLEGITGFIVKEKDLDGFAARILFLIDNPIKKEQMGQAAREFVVAHYDSAILGNKLLDLYRL